MGWIEGAMRLFPPGSIQIGGYLIPEILWPAIVFPSVTFGMLYAWPFLEARITGDHEEHHLLDRPSQVPGRTAFGVGAVTFFAMLLIAGSDDVIALTTGSQIEHVVWVLRTLVVVTPLLAAWLTYRILGSRPSVARTERQPGSSLSTPVVEDGSAGGIDGGDAG